MWLKQQGGQSPALELLESDPASGGWSLWGHFYGVHSGTGGGGWGPLPDPGQVQAEV